MYYKDGGDEMDDEESKEEIHGLVFFYPGLADGIVKIIEISITSDEERKDVQRFQRYITEILFVQNERTKLTLEGSSDYKKVLEKKLSLFRYDVTLAALLN